MAVPRRAYLIAGAVAIAVATGAGALALRGGDSGPDDRAAATPTATPTASPVPVIVPGRPGESASVIPSDRFTAADGSAYNALDVWWVRMMIPHHQQALDMAALAPDRAANPQVKAIAERILAAQRPEIEYFRSWLRTRGLPEKPDDATHDHGAMRGMQPPEAMRGLAALTGEAFDKMFVDMMVAHHEGAIAMCKDVLRVGADERLSELATSIAGEQQAEIGRLRDILS